MEIKIDRLIRSKRRTLQLEINAKAEVVVRAPNRLAVFEIERYIKSKTEWIVEKQNEMKSRLVSDKLYEEGERFLYLGRYYLLHLHEKGRCLEFDDGFHLPSSKVSGGQKQFKKWYVDRARIIFEERVKYFAKIMGLEYNSVRISGANKRWGSCSGKNNLNFSWRLVMAPLEIIDYVVIHELAHIVHKNHSRDFWELVVAYLPEYKTRRKWLKHNGTKLSL